MIRRPHFTSVLLYFNLHFLYFALILSFTLYIIYTTFIITQIKTRQYHLMCIINLQRKDVRLGIRSKVGLLPDPGFQFLTM